MAIHSPTAWAGVVNDLMDYNDKNAGTYTINSVDNDNNITFITGNPLTEMLKVSRDGFWVRGVKVEQDDKEAETVYNAFRAWMVWAELNKR